MQLDQATLDILRANTASSQQLLATIEPTPDPNPLQAQLDAALEREQALIEANATLQGIIDAARVHAQAVVTALGPVV